MTEQFEIQGMTCSHCVARVKKAIETVEQVQEAKISLESPQATITLKDNINIEELQAAIQDAGDYSIHKIAKL